MSQRDLVNGYEIIARDIGSFLYSNIKKKTKTEHTKEQLENMLEAIRLDCWDTYNNSARELGWTR